MSEPEYTLPPSARLGLTFDIDKLERDLAAMGRFDRRAQPGSYHDGSWTGIGLWNASGRADDPSAVTLGMFQATPALAVCSYLPEVLRALPAPVRVARLLFLPPGKRILDHRDGCGFHNGIVRLHVAIVTNPDVEFYIGGQRQRFGEGELWFGDFSQTHSVWNKSKETRVHLVSDVAVTDELIELFPESFVRDLRANARFVVQPRPVPVPAASLAAREGYFQIPGKLLGLPIASVLGRITSARDSLTLTMIGLSIEMQMLPIGGDAFCANALPGIRLQFTGPLRMKVDIGPRALDLEQHRAIQFEAPMTKELPSGGRLLIAQQTVAGAAMRAKVAAIVQAKRLKNKVLSSDDPMVAERD